MAMWMPFMSSSILPLFLLLMLLLLLTFLLLFACKPWRFFFPSHSSPIIKGDELERPLIADDISVSLNQSTELPRDYDVEGAAGYLNQVHLHLPQTHGIVSKQKDPAASIPSGDSLVLDVISDPSEALAVGQTLNLPKAELRETQTHVRAKSENVSLPHLVPGGSCIALEVTGGPSRGLCWSVLSTDTSRLPLTLGRIFPSDLTIKDSEVSGKHAQIKWNMDELKWELVDMGSLNGTLLNSRPINHADTGSRHWSDPVDLVDGDIITLGSTSKVLVHITPKNKQNIPFGVGMASDPMALRRGGKKLPMQDFCYYQWPLPGLDQFGLFGIYDGHGGDAAAKSACKLFPEIISNLLSNSFTQERVLSLRDASDILQNAFSQTEARMNHEYEGCTATVLLVWADGDGNYFAQCANVGDSDCIFIVDGKPIKVTEDHKITSKSERLRIEQTGEPLKDGEKRLYGINLARMLGDKFLKEQDSRFSSKPYISQVVHIDQSSRPFAILASDGLWDVVSIKKAIQLVHEVREKSSTDRENFADKIANVLLSEAKTQRTKDNTTVIFLDFDNLTSPGTLVKPSPSAN